MVHLKLLEGTRLEVSLSTGQISQAQWYHIDSVVIFHGIPLHFDWDICGDFWSYPPVTWVAVAGYKNKTSPRLQSHFNEVANPFRTGRGASVQPNQNEEIDLSVGQPIALKNRKAWQVLDGEGRRFEIWDLPPIQSPRDLHGIRAFCSSIFTQTGLRGGFDPCPEGWHAHVLHSNHSKYQMFVCWNL